MHSLTLVLAAAAIGIGFAASEHVNLRHATPHARVVVASGANTQP